ncbi:sensor histidine kinase [Actinoplanes sp. KI2]|uniref:sensor histidine kinase n=1 Tax=Actinoplanes sp. KI2 TaxID=2983315 RepID=UPI0021D58530|nr:sensor histidine kinase [Actinoplanes sp. KI2]MCU7724329.1 sensor histidine kinase [Actinoplanes sp. KI2]
MSWFTRRPLLTDAALASALLILTLGPGLVTAALTVRKPGEPVDLNNAGPLADGGWWLFAGLVLAGLTIRRYRPVLALALTVAGTCGHLALQTKYQLLDFALPLVLYSVAASARSRRRAVGLLLLTLVATYFAMLAGRVGIEDDQRAAMAAKQAQIEGRGGPIDEKITSEPVITGDVLIEAGQSALEMWLLSVAAFALGDGVRSRRAHLAAVEQRTADLAREERQRAALAVAAERTRITRELHDVVAHGMSVMVVQAQGAAAALDRHPDRAADALQHVIETGRSSLAEMRRLLAAGRTDPAGEARLSPLPGIGDVPFLVDQLRSAGMTIELEIAGVPDAVPPSVDLSAYRIVQEGLTNALKHAGPGAVTRVALDFQPDAVRLEVSDDGVGMPGGAGGRLDGQPVTGLGGDGQPVTGLGGNGLRGIAERVAMLGGDLETGPGADGAGFRLSATLPLSGPRPSAVLPATGGAVLPAAGGAVLPAAGAAVPPESGAAVLVTP